MLFFNANFICYYFYPTKKREEPKNWTIERTEPIFYNRKTEYLFGENKFGAGNEKNVHMH